MPETMQEDDDLQQGETVQLEDENNEVEDTEDGGAIIRLDNVVDEKVHLEHFANIVDEVDPTMLREAVSDLMDKIDKDKEAREKRDKQYEEGLRRTGLGDDAPGGAQFQGANKVVHPMLVESCVDFSARFMKEVFPPNGPVKSKVLGVQDNEKIAKGRRKADFMNWQTTEQMAEFRGELEQLSTQLPLGGGQYMKFMWNAQYKRPMSEFIPIDDIYLPFAATNFYTAERKTHVQYITEMEYERRVRIGMYRDVDVGAPDDPEFSQSTKANDKIEGRNDTSYNEDGLRTIFEIYTHLDFGDGVEPYILSIDKSSRKGLNLYRNWEPDDEMRKELEWIVEFPFIPWRGAYPIGLTHMIGGLSGAATGALRALLDSAHIQNIPTLLKLKGGPGGQSLNIQPTEVIEIEGSGMIDDVRKIAMPVPFNGPSPVLFQLLGFLVEAGKGVVQTTFEKLSDQNPNQPVGTTMALIEQGMVVFSSIHSRLHGSMARCFKILHRINSAYLTVEDIEAQASGLEIDPSDFDGPLDVIPVSDPSIFSDTQRFAQTQALMQRATAMPQMYDARKVEERFLRDLKVPENEVLQPKPGSEDMDPVSENVAASMGRPVFVLPKQDHMAHIQAHMAFLKSPLFGSSPVIAKTYLFPMATHLRDHLLNYYLVEAHNAVDMAHREGLIQEEASEQVKVIVQVQQFIEQQLGQFGQELAQVTEQAQQFAPQPQMPPDSSMQIAQLNAQVQGQALQQRAQAEQARMQIEQAKMQQDAALKQAQLASEDKRSQLEIAREQMRQQTEAQIRQQDAQMEMAREQMRQSGDDQRTAADLTVRERMNSADNQTAMNLAQLEIATGEKFSVTTGTGVNPGAR
jgi:chaperonin GroES